MGNWEEPNPPVTWEWTRVFMGKLLICFDSCRGVGFFERVSTAVYITDNEVQRRIDKREEERELAIRQVLES